MGNMKTTFLFFGGVGWCGTTSLYHTLRDCGYCHTGIMKENLFLYKLQEYEDGAYLEKEKFFSKYKGRIHNDKYLLNNIKLSNAVRNGEISESKYINCLANVSQTVQDRFIEVIPSSLNAYVDYYKDLANSAQGYYRTVSDFSNPNCFLPEKKLIEVRNALEPYFNIKSLIILRDPIRRLFSNINFSYYITEGGRNSEHYVNYYKEKQLNSATEVFLSNLHESFCYASLIKRYWKVFGKENTHYIIMEDFFKEERTQSVNQLETFIDYRLPKIHPCAFVPDRGINAPKLENLQDQWDSDHEILTPEVYSIARKKLSKVYDAFEDLHGFLPADWGSPIDYGY